MSTSSQRSVRTRSASIAGRVDEFGRVLVPVTIVASDGFELEIEAVVDLQFSGSLVISEQLAASVGWRCLGARRVVVGEDIKVMAHYLGLVSLGVRHEGVSVLGGYDDRCILGQRLLRGRTLTVDFKRGRVAVGFGDERPLS